jgi:hypothetical protein
MSLSSQTVADGGVQHRGTQKDQAYGDEQDIEHGSSQFGERAPELSFAA